MKRFIQVFALVVVVAGVMTSSAAAIAFADADYFWPTGGVGEPYFKQLIGRADLAPCVGTGNCSYTKIAGEFPPGIVLSSDGKVTGTPTSLGTWNFWLQIHDCCGQTAEREFSLTINRIKLAVQTASLSPAVKGSAYDATLSASGGAGSGYSWSIVDGTGKLPDGLTLDSSGRIAGTATTNGASTFTVKVTDPNGKTDTKQLTLKVVDPLGVSASKKIAEVGVPFSAVLTASGGTGPYKLAATALPSGLTFDGTQGISGTPTANGQTPIVVAVTDADGLSTSINVSLDVVAKLGIAPIRLRALTVGRAFAAKLVVRGGARPFKWSLLSGKLPSGVKLNVRTGALAGKAAAAGTYRVQVSVKDGLGGVSTRPLVFVVHA